ncbi:putative acetyltransferase [Chlamydia trachomatis]|nr:putative acetyltransferase [Chlamydia trachomatis]
MISTRFATPADAQTICDICASAYRMTYKNLSTPDYIEKVIADFYNLERVTAECSNSTKDFHGYMVAELDGQVLGCIGGAVPGNDLQGHIYVLYLHPDHKRRGMGRALVNFLTDYQKEHYGITSQLVNVAMDNYMGIPFYEAMGFAKKEQVPNWYDPNGKDTLHFERYV